ncbi:hypothetical protein CWI37_0004p0040 [Hamiltosporidium tvaerminnensis]|uniref:Uncharacterized protein n=1 Tax=Hamiltosporidium tvaerminnensis TaxID=1176355 RepID=A0A4Q9LEL9_9MICR|nr:hypothetical protein CWI37_0004p0040 [Hamiltosporidium tvaerminnensis]
MTDLISQIEMISKREKKTINRSFTYKNILKGTIKEKKEVNTYKVVEALQPSISTAGKTGIKVGLPNKEPTINVKEESDLEESSEVIKMEEKNI